MSEEKKLYGILKRILDFLISGLSVLVLSPILLIIAILIKVGSPGPVFYRGVRVGRNSQLFDMLKFRTMVVDAEKKGASSTADDDPRLTGIGKFLRKFKLDELPQLLNVVLGQMSLVGPRPQVEWATKLYKDEEKLLLSVPPGMTDVASITFRNEGEILAGSTNPDQDYLEKIAPEKIRLGLNYVRQRSLVTDFKIIMATVFALLGFSRGTRYLLLNFQKVPGTY